MVRYLFAFIVLVHGLIHFMGYTKAFSAGSLSQLTRITKTEGVLWIITAFVFITVVFLIVMKKEWWMVGIIAVLLSQTLIILSWKDAKWGTIGNVLILIPLIVACANWQFNNQYRQESDRILSGTDNVSTILTNEMLLQLPAPVQKWLHQSNVIGKQLITNVYIRQKGTMRTKPGGEWMPFDAEQYNTIDKPAFIWKSRIAPSPWLFLVARDKYEEGVGNMLIKADALIPIADSKGKEIDQGSLLRFLGEIQWFPTAALSSYIKWEAIDDSSAKATMNYGNVTASAVFYFSADGQLTYVQADRYYDRGKEKATLEKWAPRCLPNTFKEVQGIRIPYKGEVTWKLKDGDFTWLKFELEEVKYNSN